MSKTQKQTAAERRPEGEPMFTGCGTAMVTPFRRDLSLDEGASKVFRLELPLRGTA